MMCLSTCLYACLNTGVSDNIELSTMKGRPVTLFILHIIYKIDIWTNVLVFVCRSYDFSSD